MQLIGFTCPLCHRPLRQETDAYVCEGDQKIFPLIFGIPDFRVFHEGLVNVSFKGALVACLVKEYPQYSFKEFIEFDQSLDPAAQLPNWARMVVPLYHMITGFPLTRWLACLFGPLFHVVCKK